MEPTTSDRKAPDADALASLSDQALADIWYAVAGAEIRHPGCFTGLLEVTNDVLFSRLGDGLAAFVEERFRALRGVDAAEDAAANVRATSESSCDDGTQSLRLRQDAAAGRANGQLTPPGEQPPHEGGRVLP